MTVWPKPMACGVDVGNGATFNFEKETNNAPPCAEHAKLPTAVCLFFSDRLSLSFPLGRVPMGLGTRPPPLCSGLTRSAPARLITLSCPEFIVMKLITFAGPPSSGKTSIILNLLDTMRYDPADVGIVKFDCLTSFDYLRYEASGYKTVTGYSGKTCPDHYFVGNIEDAVQWGLKSGFQLLVTESAGLCNRCSPYINGISAVCVIDNLAGVNTPRKIGPMMKLADIVVVTKGDVVSQAEREVFAFNIRQATPRRRSSMLTGLPDRARSCWPGIWRMPGRSRRSGI